MRSGDGETGIGGSVAFVDVACTSPLVTWWSNTESGICAGTAQADAWVARFLPREVLEEILFFDYLRK